MEIYEILGRTFYLVSPHYLTFHRRPSEREDCEEAMNYFNNIMGFTCSIKRNNYIHEELGVYCSGLSPSFNSRESLELFLDWFEGNYGKKRIILKKEQIKI